MFAVLSVVCLWTGILVKGESLDFVIPNAGEQLLYRTSKVHPKQIALINSTSQVGVVLDSVGDRILIVNGSTGNGMVLNKRLGLGVAVSRCGGNLSGHSLQEYLNDVDIDGLVDENDNEFQFEKSSPESDTFIEQSLGQFAPRCLLGKVIRNHSGLLITGVMRFFGLIMYPLKVTLGSLLNMDSAEWMVFTGGLLAMVNILKWMALLLLSIPGGGGMLVITAIQFPFSAIIQAANGAKAFCIILRAVAHKLNLMTVFKFVLKSPLQITNFIVGLGGSVIRGTTGIFSIMWGLFSFDIWKIGSAIGSFTELILTFIKGNRVSYDTFETNCKELLTIPDQQQFQFGNGAEFEEYREFLKGVSGDTSYKIHGVVVAPLVKLLTQTTISAKATIVSALDMLSPLVPFKVSLPQLLVNMVRSLNTTDGPDYVQQMMPNLKIPQDAMYETGSVLRAGVPEDSIEELANLPAPDLLRKVPIVKDIYNELDEVVQQYRNASLESFLESHHVRELVEFTTKAIGLVR